MYKSLIFTLIFNVSFIAMSQSISSHSQSFNDSNELNETSMAEYLDGIQKFYSELEGNDQSIKGIKEITTIHVEPLDMRKKFEIFEVLKQVQNEYLEIKIKEIDNLLERMNTVVENN